MFNFIEFYQKLKLKQMFKEQDLLKKELFESDSAWEAQQIKEQLEEVDYRIKRFMVGGKDYGKTMETNL